MFGFVLAMASPELYRRFGVNKEDYDADILCGHRSSDGQRTVRVSGFGKYTTSDAVDFAAGKPYVRHPTESEVTKMWKPKEHNTDYFE